MMMMNVSFVSMFSLSSSSSLLMNESLREIINKDHHDSFEQTLVLVLPEWLVID